MILDHGLDVGVDLELWGSRKPSDLVVWLYLMGLPPKIFAHAAHQFQYNLLTSQSLASR